jgi:hypothetical protein
VANYQLTETKDRLNWAIWRQWIAANALAEMIGLGASALLWGAFAFSFSAEERLGILTSAVIVVVGSTLLEGTAVGVGQWLVLRRPLPQLRWQAWVLATMVGAFVAWSLGMIPSTMMALGEETSSQPPLEINDLVMYSLAAVMGLVLGPILGLPQWWVLRRHLHYAAWWIPANAVAWALGMVAIFVGTSFIPESGLTAGVVLIILLSLATAGALVGAVHGWVLIWLLKEDKT